MRVKTLSRSRVIYKEGIPTGKGLVLGSHTVHSHTARDMSWRPAIGCCSVYKMVANRKGQRSVIRDLVVEEVRFREVHWRMETAHGTHALQLTQVPDVHK